MTHSGRFPVGSPGRSRRPAIGIGTAATLAACGLLAGNASAASGANALSAASGVKAPVDCPASFPTASAVDGVKGTGFTVERGTTPAPFTAKVIGRIASGIAPGVDMIMAELDSPALRRAGGVWAGMSGSPVYSSDGRLIGSVSYVLSASPTRIAGITPAESMRTLLTRSAKTNPLRPKVSTPSVAAQRITVTGAASTAQALGGFTPLTVPLWVSGATGGHAAELLKRLQDKAPGTRVMAGGTTGSLGSGSGSQIRAGGNFAASVAYGDATLAGIGTTTFVCKGVAVAFGHPFLDSGTSSMTVHAASAVLVQPDALFGPYKVANLTTPVGTMTGDYTTGVRGQLGKLPPFTEITSSLSTPGRSLVTGTTRATYAPYTPDAAAFHTLANVQKALNSDAPGSAAITITVKGLRANGSAFTLTRTDRFASTYSIAYTVADQVYMLASDLVNQPFEKVRLTAISVTGSVEPTVRQYRVSALDVKQGGTFAPVTDPLNVPANSSLTIRATLAPYQGTGATRTVTLTLPIPAGLSGTSTSLAVLSGNGQPVPDLSTFAALLTRWQTVGLNTSLVATLNPPTGTTPLATATGLTDAAVSPYSKAITVNVS